MQKHGPKNKIYWIGAPQIDSDRAFVDRSTDRLKHAGYQVVPSLDRHAMHGETPSAESMFREETAMLLDCDVVVAFLASSPLSSALAGKIGIAFAFGIPVIGLFRGENHLYRDSGVLYEDRFTLGALQAGGNAVASEDALLAAVDAYANDCHKSHRAPSVETVREHFSSVSGQYGDFIARLERWYHPTWSLGITIEEWMRDFEPMRIFEIGCGVGGVGPILCSGREEKAYIGYDSSPSMVELAKKACCSRRCCYTSDRSELHRRGPFDCGLALFTLHDHPDKFDTLSWAVSCLKEGGLFGLIDLSTQDLPFLTDRLRRGLARPAVCADARIDPLWLNKIVRDLSMQILEYRLVVLDISFPSARDVLSGQPVANLVASTSGTDSDWVVKLIDVYPDQVAGDASMGGYQLMISADIFRGRYRESLETARPISPGQPLLYRFNLPTANHVFVPGHRIMVQIQSSWFPLYDRNPQTFVPNVFWAKSDDYRKTEQRVYHAPGQASFIELPLVAAP